MILLPYYGVLSLLFLLFPVAKSQLTPKKFSFTQRIACDEKTYPFFIDALFPTEAVISEWPHRWDA